MFFLQWCTFIKALGYKSSKPWLILPSTLLPDRGHKHPRQPFRRLRRKAPLQLDCFWYKLLPWFDLKGETSYQGNWTLEPLKWFKREFRFFWKEARSGQNHPRCPKPRHIWVEESLMSPPKFKPNCRWKPVTIIFILTYTVLGVWGPPLHVCLKIRSTARKSN